MRSNAQLGSGSGSCGWLGSDCLFNVNLLGICPPFFVEEWLNVIGIVMESLAVLLWKVLVSLLLVFLFNLQQRRLLLLNHYWMMYHYMYYG